MENDKTIFKKVLVTGAKGMLGRDLCPILEQVGYEVIMTDYQELDITNKDTVIETVSKIKPDLIIHCAAYTNVDKAETDELEAYKLNVEGTKNIAVATSEVDATIVYISTDYVFDGRKTTPYYPLDNPNPLSVYGKTKLLGEKEIQKHCKKYYIARTAWLYGIYGKNFVETMITLANEKGKLSVVDDQTGSPTWTIELIQGILKILKSNEPYGIYHISGQKETSWFEFAKKIFELENITVELNPCTTEDFKRPAQRPKYSYIENPDLVLTRPWVEALKDYLKLRKNKI